MVSVGGWCKESAWILTLEGLVGQGVRKQAWADAWVRAEEPWESVSFCCVNTPEGMVVRSVPAHPHPCDLCHSSCPSSGYLVRTSIESCCDGQKGYLWSSVWTLQYGSRSCNDPEHLQVPMSFPTPSIECKQKQNCRTLTPRGIWDIRQKTPVPLLSVTEENLRFFPRAGTCGTRVMCTISVTWATK